MSENKNDPGESLEVAINTYAGGIHVELFPYGQKNTYKKIAGPIAKRFYDILARGENDIRMGAKTAVDNTIRLMNHLDQIAVYGWKLGAAEAEAAFDIYAGFKPQQQEDFGPNEHDLDMLAEIGFITRFEQTGFVFVSKKGKNALDKYRQGLGLIDVNLARKEAEQIYLGSHAP